ncbi:MAG: MnhB domain-containing protein [Bdellovibrionota bacterium]
MNKGFGSTLLALTARIHFPFMLLFAIYVVIHGHYSPGGGFQGGILLTMAMILLDLIWGAKNPLRPSHAFLVVMGCLGVCVYFLIGMIALLRSKPFLDYSALTTSTEAVGHVRAFGSLGIEMGVTITVFATSYLIYQVLRGDHSS